MRKIFYICLTLLIFTTNMSIASIINNVVPITTGEILKYEKFELGINLFIEQSEYNVYDPNEISIEVTFTAPSGKQYTVYGFYFTPYTRNDLNSPPLTSNVFVWNQQSTDYPWRVRFAPNEEGSWSYIVSVYDNKRHIGDNSEDLSFICSDSDNPGFIKIAENNRYFEFENDNSFFAIAEDLRAHTNTIPYSSGFPGFCTNGNCCYTHMTLRKYIDWINEFSENGGNYIRVWLEPYSFEIEWEELGVYEQRQYRMSDLDYLIEYASQKGVYIHLVLYNEQHLKVRNKQEVANWDDNPYKYTMNSNPLLANVKWGADFFDNVEAQRIFKNRLRYIHSRWGYSTAIASYGLINEPEFIGQPGENYVDNGRKYFNSSNSSLPTIYNEFNLWVSNMYDYLKNVSYPKHLISVDYANPFSSADNVSNLDFVNCHDYSWDKNAESQRNYIAQYNLGRSNKPFTMTENGVFASECWISLESMNDIHNEIWATSFLGSIGTTFYFGGQIKYHNHEYPNVVKNIKYYKTLFNFIKDETFNEKKDFYKPIGNTFYSHSLEGSTQSCPPQNYPFVERAGYAPWTSKIGNTFNEEYLLKGIQTTFDDKIEVYGLKKHRRIIGWVHNKEYYWYNLQHAINDGCNSVETKADPASTCVELDRNILNIKIPDDFNNLPKHTVNVSSINDAYLIISDLECNGLYEIEWYCTEINKENGILDDRGKIIDLNGLQDNLYLATDNYVVFPIPELRPYDWEEPNSSIFSPDYGFKINFISSNGIENGYWKHSYADEYDWNNSVTNHQVDGDYITNSSGQIFYRSNSGYMEHFYYDQDDDEYIHDGLVQNWWNQPLNFKVAQESSIVSSIPSNGHEYVFYKGHDGRMQVYYWNVNQWLHSYPGTNLHYVDGKITNGNDGQIFYRGLDGFIQHFYFYNSQFYHDGLVLNWWTQNPDYRVANGGEIKVNNLGHVFYKGYDNKLQYYFWNGSAWVHSYASVSNPIVSGSINFNNSNNEVYFVGGSGYIERLTWNANLNEYTHDFLVVNSQPNEWKVNLMSPITVPSNGNIIYNGTDGKIQYYFKNGLNWQHDYLQDGNTFNSIGDIAYDNNDQIYYNGDDNYIQHFWGSYVHDGLVPDWWNQDNNFKIKTNSKILINSNNHVFYHGNDGRMQYYSWKNNCGSERNAKKEVIESKKPANVINDKNNIVDYNINPNPFTDKITVSVNLDNNSSSVYVQVINVMGVVCFTSEKLNVDTDYYYQTLDLSHLDSGFYIINVIENDKSIIQSKIIKTN